MLKSTVWWCHSIIIKKLESPHEHITRTKKNPLVLTNIVPHRLLPSPTTEFSSWVWPQITVVTLKNKQCKLCLRFDPSHRLREIVFDSINPICTEIYCFVLDASMRKNPSQFPNRNGLDRRCHGQKMIKLASWQGFRWISYKFNIPIISEIPIKMLWWPWPIIWIYWIWAPASLRWWCSEEASWYNRECPRVPGWKVEDFIEADLKRWIIRKSSDPLA